MRDLPPESETPAEAIGRTTTTLFTNFLGMFMNERPLKAHQGCPNEWVDSAQW